MADIPLSLLSAPVTTYVDEGLAAAARQACSALSVHRIISTDDLQFQKMGYLRPGKKQSANLVS